MNTAIPATEVKTRFGRVLRQVTQSDDPIIIERGGKPVAVLVSIAAWQALQPSANRSLTMPPYSMPLLACGLTAPTLTMIG